MFVFYNPNPARKLVGDCVVRAIARLTNQSWEDTYIDIVMQGLKMYDMPSANHVWGTYLKSKGFNRYLLPNTCPDCYTVKDFCVDYPQGEYMLATGSHVIAVEDGNYYDAWDSGDEIPVYYWKLEV